MNTDSLGAQRDMCAYFSDNTAFSPVSNRGNLVASQHPGGPAMSANPVTSDNSAIFAEIGQSEREDELRYVAILGYN